MRLALILLLLAAAGCAADPVASVQAPAASAAYAAHESSKTTQTVTEEEMRRVAGGLDRSMSGSVYYMGRKDGFDYFLVAYIATETYRVSAPNGIVKSPMAFTSHQKLWVDCRSRTGNGWLP